MCALCNCEARYRCTGDVLRLDLCGLHAGPYLYAELIGLRTWVWRAVKLEQA